MKRIPVSQLDKLTLKETINEVRLLAALDNPYITSYYESFMSKQHLNIVMEYCDKGDLRTYMKSQKGIGIPEAKIWKVLLQMCLALEYLHSRNIIHGDIKPMNVFLTREDLAKIGDFGIAKFVPQNKHYPLAGTLAYLAPEVIQNASFNEKRDVWALGCVLYELCTQKHPFDAANETAISMKIERGTYPPLAGSYSGELKEVVEACLVKDPSERPSIKTILQKKALKDKARLQNIYVPPNSELKNETRVFEFEKLQKVPSLKKTKDLEIKDLKQRYYKKRTSVPQKTNQRITRYSKYKFTKPKSTLQTKSQESKQTQKVFSPLEEIQSVRNLPDIPQANFSSKTPQKTFKPGSKSPYRLPILQRLSPSKASLIT